MPTTQVVALVVSDLYPYTADERADRVYTVIELEGAQDKPHRAIVEAHGIRKDDLVNVRIERCGSLTYYHIIGKAVPASSQQHDLSPR